MDTYQVSVLATMQWTVFLRAEAARRSSCKLLSQSDWLGSHDCNARPALYSLSKLVPYDQLEKFDSSMALTLADDKLLEWKTIELK